MSYQTEIEGMEKKGIETVEHDYVTCYECGSYEDCDCDGYNQALQDVLPVIERAVAAERERVKLDSSDMQKVGDHYWGGDYEPTYYELEKLTESMNEILQTKLKDLDNTPPNKV